MVQIDCILDEKSIIVTAEILSKILNVSTRQIATYLKKGMPKHTHSTHKKNLFNLIECYEWVKENIDKSKSSKIDNFNILEVKEKREYADMERAVEQAKIEKIKRLQLEGSLIEKEDTDKALSELGATMGGFYRNDIKSLPFILENKTSAEIKQELNKHYKDRIEDMNKIVSKEVDVKEDTVYDKLIEWLKELNCE